MNIAFHSAEALPVSVMASWGAYWPGSDRRLFCLTEGEVSCIDIYDPVSQFHVVICQGDKQHCEDWVNRHFELSGSAEFKLKTDSKACCFTRQSDRLIVIWLCLPSEEDGSLVFALIAHEALHAAYAIMDGMGMKPDFANEEWTAYMVQFIVGNFCQSIGIPVPFTEGVA